MAKSSFSVAFYKNNSWGWILLNFKISFIKWNHVWRNESLIVLNRRRRYLWLAKLIRGRHTVVHQRRIPRGVTIRRVTAGVDTIVIRDMHHCRLLKLKFYYWNSNFVSYMNYIHYVNIVYFLNILSKNKEYRWVDICWIFIWGWAHVFLFLFSNSFFIHCSSSVSPSYISLTPLYC